MPMPNMHHQFSSAETLRYAAACKRLARLSRDAKPASGTTHNKPTFSDWLVHMWHAPRKPAAKLAHR